MRKTTVFFDVLVVLSITFLILSSTAPLAYGATPIQDPHGGGGELNLYQVVNQMMGTNFQSSSELANLEIKSADPYCDGWWFESDGHISIKARYAGYVHRLYWDDGFFEGFIMEASGGAGIENVNIDFTIDGGNFYFKDVTDGGIWYSIDGLNEDGLTHMVVFDMRAFEADTFICAFEDYNGLGDQDYNDLVFKVSYGAAPTSIPTVSDIPDLAVTGGDSFPTISLDDYVEDCDNIDSEINWTTSGGVNISVNIDSNRVATITYPGGWTGSETITFTATDPDGNFHSDQATFTVNPPDADGDGVPDDDDNCPNTPNPGQEDTDGDGVGNICDNCPNDPNPGQADTDGDGSGDACDNCPSDPNKINPGVCGCGTPDTDSDGDGTPDCNDNCPSDPNKIGPGVCGCGTPDTDSDGDGTPDCIDNCPSDPNKINPGVCGCGVADTDIDGDGIANCIDNCIFDYNPNQADSDEDGIGDACEGDSDSDGVIDDNDNCPYTYNPNQVDTDGDGVGNLCDNCPNDPNPGQADTDGDGSGDACDNCPSDPNKINPGACGCGTPDTDSDGDGTPDCNDNCPSDPNKTNPGACGCGTPDTDSDGDGTPDCIDNCPNDPNKTNPGICGCGTPDTDSDGDGTPDCIDNCPSV
jgi:hypothetical protein